MRAAGVFIGVLLVAIVAMFGAFLWKNWDVGTAPAATIATATPTGTTPTTSLASCPSDNNVDGQVRLKDTLATGSVSYVNATVYWFPETSGYNRQVTPSLQTDGTYSTAINLDCSTGGVKWTPKSITTLNGAHAADGITYTSTSSRIEANLEGKRHDTLQFKVEDKFAGASTFFNISVTGVQGTGYRVMNGSRFNVTDIAGASSLSLDADEYIDAVIYLKTNNTKRQFGEDRYNTWMVIDSNKNKWEEPIVSRGTSGATFSNEFSSMQSTDQNHYAGYEYGYKIGSVGDAETQLTYYQRTASGINPTGADAINVDFCAEGRYNSLKQADTLLVGCWNDATTEAQVASPYLQGFFFGVY